jgi:putative ABC transport system permease protein
MNLLIRAQLRFLRRAPWSALTAWLGVALAVASIVAVHQIGTAVNHSVDAARPPHLAGLTHLVTRADLSARDYFELRQAWRAAHWPQVTALVPVLDGRLDVDGLHVRVIGADWLAYPVGRVQGIRTSSPTGLAPWQLLDGAGLVVDQSLDLAVGTEIEIKGRTYTVTGVVDSALGPTILADIAVAARLLDVADDALSLIGVAAADPWAFWRRLLDALMPGFAAGLPAPALQLVSPGSPYSIRSMDSELPAAAFARSILFNLGALGLLALVVAWFLVQQVAGIWVERQRRVFARLHAIGAEPVAVAAAFGMNFVLLGVLATLAGIAIGHWLASLLLALSLPTEAAAETPVVLPAAVAWPLLTKAVVSGVGLCSLGGLLALRSAMQPARRAGEGWRWRVPAALGAALLLVLGIAWEDSGLFGGFAAILALCAMLLLAVRPLFEWARRLAGAAAGRPRRVTPGVSHSPRGLLVRLGVREALWQPRVVGVAAAALSLAAATSVGIGLMVESLRADFTRMMDARLGGDLYLTGRAAEVQAVPDWLRAWPEPVGSRSYGGSLVRVSADAGARADLPVDLGYARFDTAESLRYGYPMPLRADQALINERLARALRIDRGDAVLVAGQRLIVVHVFTGFGDAEPRLLVDVAALLALGLAPVFDRLTLDVASGAGQQMATQLAAALAARWPELEITEREALRTRVLRLFDRTFAMTRALTLLALLVAAVGIYNALTALRLNQAPTRRLLTAQGVTAGEQVWVTVARSATVGGGAVLLAMPLGIGMAWLLCEVINPRAFGWTIRLALPWSGWGPPLLIGFAAAVLAGLLPAPSEQGELDEAG